MCIRDSDGTDLTDRDNLNFSGGLTATDDSANDQSDISISAGGVDTNELADDAVTNAKMAVNSVDSDQYVDASIDNEHISNGAINNAKISSTADIDLSKLSDSDTLLTINSSNYSIGDSLTILPRHTVQDDGSDLTSRSNLNLIDPLRAFDDSANDQTDVSIEDRGIVTNLIANDAITNQKLADNSVDSAQYVNGSIDHEHLGTGIIDNDNVSSSADIALSKLSDSDTLFTLNSTNYSIGDLSLIHI